MNLEITAKLLYSLPEQTGEGKNGPWVKQDFIVETEDQYPKKVCMSAWGDLVSQFKAFSPGTRLKISFRIESREYNSRWYTDVRPWKVAIEGSQPVQEMSSAPAIEPVAATPEGADDLPF